MAKEKNIKRMSLAVAVGNAVAKEAYTRLGFKFTGQKFYGYDFAMGETHSESYFKENTTLEIMQNTDGVDIVEELKLMETIMQRKPEFQSKQLVLMKEKQVLGYCEYYYEYSVWRCGPKIIFESFWGKKGYEKELVANVLRYTYQNCKERAKSILFLIEKGETRIL